MITATILGAAIHFFSYSPLWLVLVGRNEECLLSLGRLRALPVTDPRLRKEFKGIVVEVEFDKAVLELKLPGVGGARLEMLAWTDLFRRRMIQRTVVGAGACFFQQFSGINALIFCFQTSCASIGT